ncbi:MAG: N-acetylmuramic acid 6-phosphate etherase [Clostridiales bacterium]|nr:N-acetylmuramic acid 6-phosphate etherase [Clostridiales bacterium]
MEFDKLTTEQVNTESLNLDLLTPYEAAQLMNRIDHQAVEAVNAALPAIGEAVEKIAVRLRRGGRLIYMGAGTSGRLGVLDASECPPTFGVDKGLVIGLIAGGDSALRNASEDAEDKPELGRQALEDVGLREADAVVGISASGYAPYCVGGMDYARSCGALVIALTCNRNAIISGHADIAIEMPTGPEILSGSTRLKAGTATKLALNMLSTLTMVQLGKVYRNLMVDMQPANDKLRDRSVRIVQKALNGMEREQAERLYAQAGNSIQTAIVMGETGADAEAARQALNACDGIIRRAVDGLKK